MSNRKAYDRGTKRSAFRIWLALSAALLGAMLLPLYWFWPRLAARPVVLVVVLGLLSWALFNWWKLVISMIKGLRNLPEQ